MNKNRLDYLDSIRGLAAFSVLIYHFIFSLDTFHYWDGRRIQYFLAMIFNGADAVSLFFVLSGLVLSYKYFNAEKSNVQINYPAFVIQRIFRIYPAYLVMISCFFLYNFRAYLSLDFFLNGIFKEDHNFIIEALLIRKVHEFYLPGWTLEIEIALSLLVPVLIIVALKYSKMLKWLILVSFFFNSVLSPFLFHFILGVWLGKNFDKIKKHDFKSSKIYPFRGIFYFLVAILYSVRFFNDIFSFGTFFSLPNYYFGLTAFHITGVASCLILWKAINSSSWQKILRWKPFLFLGRISYSVYLTHWFVIFNIFIGHPKGLAELFYFGNHIYMFGLLFCILSTIIIATAMYYLIEMPLIRFGKKVSKKYFPDNLNSVTI